MIRVCKEIRLTSNVNVNVDVNAHRMEENSDEKRVKLESHRLS